MQAEKKKAAQANTCTAFGAMLLMFDYDLFCCQRLYAVNAANKRNTHPPFCKIPLAYIKTKSVTVIAALASINATFTDSLGCFKRLFIIFSFF